ncbi:MAG: response regulator [Calditrichaeota bacterium]|nr:MAG: response regulator [Calditrichota bacterium]
MGQVFQRSESLQDQIFSLKLRIPEWKVLFSVDGVMDEAQLAEFLSMDLQEVSAVLKQLRQQGLVTVVGGSEVSSEEPGVLGETATGEAEAQPTDASAEPEAPVETEGLEAAAQPEEEAETFTESSGQDALLEEFDEFDLLSASSDLEADEDISGTEAAEQPEESPGEEAAQAAEAPEAHPSEEDSSAEALEFPGEEEDFLQSMGEETESEAGEGGEDLFAGLEESGTAGEAEDDFDKLIGDLIEEAPESAEESAEARSETQSAEAPTETAEEDFDISSIFDEELAATEQSLKEMLGSIEQEEAIAETAPPKQAEPGAQKTILVVDDSVVIRKMVEIALENENYNIVSVATGKEALQYLDEHTPDLIILDIMLTDVNGLDILKAVKASKNIPVVMLSAKDTPRETTMAKELGADDFIPKPFKDEELVSKVRELIEA